MSLVKELPVVALNRNCTVFDAACTFATCARASDHPLLALRSGHIKDVQVSGSHFQNIGIVNCASVNIIRPTSTFCMGTDIAINDFSLDCASECGRLRPSPFC